MDREERAAWREAQKRQVEIRMAELQVEDKKRLDEIRIAQIEAEAEEKKRADEIRFSQIEVAKEQAKLEAEKELRLKRWNYKLNKLKLKLPPVLQPLHPLVIKMPSPRSYHRL